MVIEKMGCFAEKVVVAAAAEVETMAEVVGAAE